MPGDPNSIGAARACASGFLTDTVPALPPATIADALLAVSELVTNAVRHAPGPCTLEIGVDESYVCIRVSDTSRVAPTARAPHYDGSGGFGLHMLRALAGHVETVVHKHGKSVLVRLTLA